MANDKGWLIIVGIAIVILLVANPSILSNITGKNSGSTPGSSIPPADKQQTITLNTKNALSPTDISANVSYYVFKEDGSFVKSGTTSAGTASFTVNYGNNYKVLAFTDGTYYPNTVTFLADGNGAALQTINMGLNPVSNATVSKVRNPIDLTTNITVGLGQTVNFDVLYSTTASSSAINKPVIVVDVNQTSVQDVSLGGLAKTTCPARLTTTAQRKKICFQDTTHLSSEGIKTISGNVLFSNSVAPSQSDTLTVTIIDTQEYADPNYVVKGFTAFHEGTENLNDNSNVGATDSNVGTLTFAN